MSARIILASASKARGEMLRGAGVAFDTMPADIDESSVQHSGCAPIDIALELAQQKALHISQQHLDAFVIGSDQILEFQGQLLHKSTTVTEALDKLRLLQGQTHTLISAVALAHNGKLVWHHHDSAQLTMHVLEESFLQHYATRAEEALLTSVGGYWLEDAGAWLFEKVQGDYFTILGMPLLPLLGQLRTQYNMGWSA